jgi:hypothetical protein
VLTALALAAFAALALSVRLKQFAVPDILSSVAVAPSAVLSAVLLARAVRREGSRSAPTWVTAPLAIAVIFVTVLSLSRGAQAYDQLRFRTLLTSELYGRPLPDDWVEGSENSRAEVREGYILYYVQRGGAWDLVSIRPKR